MKKSTAPLSKNKPNEPLLRLFLFVDKRVGDFAKRKELYLLKKYLCSFPPARLR